VSALLKAELVKLRTTRTFAAIAGSAAGLSLLVVVLITTLGGDFSEQDVKELYQGDFTPLFILILGVVGMAGEWRHRTITSSILAAPDRVRFLLAKALSYAVAGAVMSLIVTAAIALVGTVILSARGEPTIGVVDLADVLWRNLAVAALLGALGVGIGALVRNQIAAIVGLLIFSFAVEPTVLGLAPDVGRFGPTGAAPNGILGADPFESGQPLLAPGVAVLVMLAWIGAALGAGGWLLRRRDLT
jgi:ABC-2 type transport system permease protein